MQSDDIGGIMRHESEGMQALRNQWYAYGEPDRLSAVGVVCERYDMNKNDCSTNEQKKLERTTHI
jgi:hypothetical protein